MSILEITELTHAFGDRVLYRDAEVTLNRGEHMGIVGPNGAGKSTLIKICTGQMVPDEGRVVWQRGVTLGYLDQYASTDSSVSMEQFLKSAFESQYRMESEMAVCYQQAAEGKEEALERAARLQEKLEKEEFYTIDTRIAQIVTGLGLSALGTDRRLEEMSGGQRAKVILAKMLLKSPDVLLLDEPTNFLDKEHVEWLAGYLAGLSNAFMVVSHDYEFLEKISDRVLDVDNGKLQKYYGSYSEFLKKKTLLREDYIRQYTAQQKEIKKTEEFIRRNIAGRKTRMAKGRRKQLERMVKMEAPVTKEMRPRFHFPALPSTNAEHLIVKHLAVGYHYPVLPDISLSVMGGQKIVITGFNGIGKSTLLKTLTGEIKALGGTFHFSEQVTVGYFEQELIWEDPDKTPLKVVSDRYPGMVQKAVRSCLAHCGISAEHARQPVGTLSGGEQAKVRLCLLTLKPCNFLILDEPTNHLDAGAKEALQEAVIQFPGTVLLVSHEEAFYREWAQKVVHIEKSV